jgi:hypothetical protein
MLGVAIHQRSVEIEQQRGFHNVLAWSARVPISNATLVTSSLRSARA